MKKKKNHKYSENLARMRANPMLSRKLSNYHGLLNLPMLKTTVMYANSLECGEFYLVSIGRLLIFDKTSKNGVSE